MTAPVIQQQAQARIAAASAAAAVAVASASTGSVSTGPAASSAAAAVFGQGTPTAVAQAVGSIVNGNAAATQRAVDVTTAAIERLWQATDPYDNAAVQDFAEQAGQLIVAAQRSVAQTTSASQAILARAAGLRSPGGVHIPDDVRGAQVSFGAEDVTVHAKPKATITYRPDTQDGKTTRATVTESAAQPDQIFQRAAVTYRYEQSRGADQAAAVKAAVQRIGDIVDGNLMLAQRLAEQQTLKQAGAKFYRRVIHPELSRGGVCGLCVAASDRVYRTADLKPLHMHCKCGVVPVAAGFDAGYQLHQDDLSALYDEAGSTGAAGLKRNRYDIVHHAELGPVLTRVDGEKVPYYSTTRPSVAVDAGRASKAKPVNPKPVKPLPQSKESPAAAAARHLPALRESLKNLRSRGLAESSAPVQYHLQQIAKFEKAL